MMKTSVLRIAATAVAMALGQVHADEIKSVNVPAGDLAVALQTLASQAGVELVYRPEQLKGLQTKGVQGTLSSEEAARKLIEGTALTVQSDPSGLLLISSDAPSQTSADRRAASIRLAQAETAGAARAANDTNSSSKSSDVEESMKLEEIIVTAQKRRERLQDVAASIQVVSASNLEAHGIAQLSDYSKLVPGLKVIGATGPGQGLLVIRGVSTSNDRNPLSAVYLDDVPFTPSGARTFSHAFAFDPTLADIDHVEVLKGPQSTLYGASAMGGIVRFVSKTPNPDAFESSVRLEGAQVDGGGAGHNARASANIPLGDRAAARVALTHRREPGYLDDRLQNKDDVNSVDVEGARAAVTVNLTDNLETTFAGFYQQIDNNGPAKFPLDSRLKPVAGLSVASSINETYSVKSISASNVTTLNLGFATLINIISYAEHAPITVSDLNSFAPLFGAPAGSGVKAFGDVSSERISDEIRLTSAPGRVEWMIGGFYTDQKDRAQSDYRGIDASGALLPQSSPFFNYYTFTNRSTYEEWAGFGNVTAHFTDRIEATVGVRYSTNDQDFRVVSTGLLGVNNLGEPSEDSATNYLATVSFKPTDKLTAYVRAASAYRPGGANVLNAVQRTFNPPTTFDADQLWNYEIGVKGRAWDERVVFSAAAFHMDWTDIQINVPVANFQITGNAGKASSEGAEAAVTLSPIEGLQLGVNGLYNKAQIEANAPSIFAREGDPLPYSPEWSGAATVDYSVGISNGVNAFAGATYAYFGDVYGYFRNGGQFKLPHYSTVDLRAGVEFGKYTVTARVDNLTDRYALTTITPSNSVGRPLVGTAVRPRTFVLAFEAQF